MMRSIDHSSGTGRRRAVRRRLPEQRQALAHKNLNRQTRRLHYRRIEQKQTPREILMTMSREGSTISGLMPMPRKQPCSRIILQYGVPLRVLGEKSSRVPIRAERVHRKQGHPDRKIRLRLYLQMARKEVSASQRSAEKHAQRKRVPCHNRGFGPRGKGQPSFHSSTINKGRTRGVSSAVRHSSLPRVRKHHGAQWKLLQMRELWRDLRMSLMSGTSRFFLAGRGNERMLVASRSEETTRSD